jgi:NurA-like 5'-3' nuclease
VLIDENLKSHLIEVNVLPSLFCPSRLDKRIKLSMLKNSFHLIGMVPFDRSNLENEIKKLDYLPSTLEKKEEIQILQESEDELNRMGSFKRIFPNENNPFKHHELLDERNTTFNETLASFEESKKIHSIEFLHQQLNSH